ncbi:hypothetical protein DC498_08205 [Terrimonas sp.]|nr:hypothetical protein DC498_08205 [Terrimonas sp.]
MKNQTGTFKIVAIKKVKLENQIKVTVTESAFMALVQKRYVKLQALNKINSFYDYQILLSEIKKLKSGITPPFYIIIVLLRNL